MLVKKLILIVFLISVAPNVAAITDYKINIEGNSVIINATFELYTDNPEEKVNYWQASFGLPEGFELLSIKDSIGDIKDYTIAEGEIKFKTNRGHSKNKEVVNLILSGNSVNTAYNPLKYINFSLSGFSDKRPDVSDEITYVTLNTDERILSETHSFGFVSKIDGKEIKYIGEGPINFGISYSNSGMDYNHYVLFGNANITKADEMFDIIIAVVGILPSFEKFPVVILSNEKYREKVNDWSSGEYKNGIIFIKQSETMKSELTATMLHETSHGFNEEALRWSKTDITWFDEGVAKYIEFLVNKNLGIRQSEIFGKSVRWTEGSMVYTLSPRGTPEMLWSYYLNNQDFMRYWNPKNPETREFGYAFSELMIRYYIQQNGPDSLHPVFKTLLEADKEAATSDEYNEIILSAMNANMYPCYFSQRVKFESCLQAVNAMGSNIPTDVEIEGQKRNITIPQIEPPEESKDFFSGIVDAVLGFFDSVISWIGSLFGKN